MNTKLKIDTISKKKEHSQNKQMQKEKEPFHNSNVVVYK
jgi:hypothetical protein